MKLVFNQNTVLKINNSLNNRLSVVICWTIFMLFLDTSAYILESVTGITYQTVSLFSWVSTFLLLLFNFSLILKSVDKKVLLIFVILIFIFLLNYLYFGYSEGFAFSARRFFLKVLPIVIVCCSIKNFDILLHYLNLVSKVVLIFSLVVTIVSRNNMTTTYNMGFSYSLLLPIILLIFNYYNAKHFKTLLFILAGILSILLTGARGPFLGIVFVIVILFLKNIVTPKNFLLKFTIVFLFISCLFVHKIVLQSLIEITNSLGWYSRTLYLLYNDAYHDSGRLYIYQAILDELDRNPFKIHGIAGEYEFTGGMYAHNFILELLCGLGIIFGSLVVIYIVFRIARTIWNFIKKDSSFNFCSCAFLAASVPSLLVSGTIWGNAYFWIWLLLFENGQTKSVRNNDLLPKN